MGGCRRVECCCVLFEMPVTGDVDPVVGEPVGGGSAGGTVLRHVHAGRHDPKRQLLTVCGVSRCACSDTIEAIATRLAT